MQQMNPRFFEIENEIGLHLQAILNLRTEKRKIIQLSQPDKANEVLLYFVDDTRTIRWYEKSIRFSKKQYQLIKTLWQSDNHEATLDNIEEQVWDVGTEKQPFIERHTIFTFVQRAQNQLKKCDFPYKIVPVKNFSTRENKGYKLICAR
jgi:DNA-binding response OmpR family regulator